MDIENKFTGMMLEEIKSVGKDNSRSIADANLRIMTLTDKVDDVKEDTRTVSEIIAEMKEDVDLLIKLNVEQKKTNQDISVLLEQIMGLQKDMRRDIDKILDKEEVSYGKVGVV